MAYLSKLGYYLLRIAKALDRLANAFIGGNDKETLSSVAYRKWRDHKPFGYMKTFVDWLFYDGHCHQAYLNDRDPKLLPA